jgi:hypothetical protein
MENPTITLTFKLDTWELEINAPAMPFDFAIALLDRAKHLLETQEKILLAQQIRANEADVQKANSILRNVKIQ